MPNHPDLRPGQPLRCKTSGMTATVVGWDDDGYGSMLTLRGLGGMQFNAAPDLWENDTTVLETLRIECQATPERETHHAERRHAAALDALEDRISVNVGAATMVAEPHASKPGFWSVFVERPCGEMVGPRGVTMSPDEALDLLDAAKAQHFVTAYGADAWLTEVWASLRFLPAAA